MPDVRHLPGRYHVDHPYRLIFEPHEQPIPTDKDGKYIWIEIKGVEIIEIKDYH